ncbi:hypothetical protein KC345_g62 [Hortaea werneckii]|nr:hypothetical protein KC345_g62 [Hortaea werneckii]
MSLYVSAATILDYFGLELAYKNARAKTTSDEYRINANVSGSNRYVGCDGISTRSILVAVPIVGKWPAQSCADRNHHDCPRYAEAQSAPRSESEGPVEPKYADQQYAY